MIPEQTVETVRSTVNIADYIGQFVALRKQGQNLFGVCPFHAENTPSFSVNESKQIFKCFSCGRGGNVFTFVMDLDHLSFPEAVAKVADFAHIDIGVTVGPTRAPENPAHTVQKKLLRAVTDLGHHILVNTAAGEKALAYLTERGLSRATIDHFEIGFAPPERTLMRTFLENQHTDYAVMRQSGLFVEDEQGTLFDRFNDRVLFPLKDEFGEVIGFSGRTLDPEAHQAKYLNSPETELFNKSQVLFNLDAAKNEFKTTGQAVLFEGFMDVIAAYQAGVRSGIASMGTSLTQDQVTGLARHTQQLTLCYDGDAAGQKATARALTLMPQSTRLKVNVVVLPGAMDPDEFIKARGSDAFQAAISSVLTPVAFQLYYLKQGRDLTNDQAKLDYLQHALAVIASERQPVAQAVYLKQVSEDTGVPVADLKQALPKPLIGTVSETGSPLPPPPPPPPPPGVFGDSTPSPAPVRYDKFELAERELVYLAWTHPAVARRLHVADFTFAHDAYQRLFDGWLAYVAAHEDASVASYLDTLPPELVATAADIAMLERPEPDAELIEDLMQTVAAVATKDRLAALKTQMQEAQLLGDKDLARQLTQEYLNLMRSFKAERGA